MNGNHEGRPESARRAPDPSLEEMLRRARDARLGDETDYDRPAPPAHMPLPGDGRDSKLWGWLLFAAGILAGVLLSICVATVAATIRSWTAQVAPAAPTAAVTALPAVPISTPMPLPTITPTATSSPTMETVAPPLTTGEIISLMRDFYDTQGPYATSYVLLDVTDLQIQNQDETELTACISYEAVSVDDPDTPTLSNTRLFTLAADSDGRWQVVQMGGDESCSLS